jgi:hypothetical protein
MGTGACPLLIDGSGIGLANTDVDVFELQAGGSMLMSFDADSTLSGFGAVDDSDVLRFTPTSSGGAAAGRWAWCFDGSDVGLSPSDEDVDAFAMVGAGNWQYSVAMRGVLPVMPGSSVGTRGEA